MMHAGPLPPTGNVWMPVRISDNCIKLNRKAVNIYNDFHIIVGTGRLRAGVTTDVEGQRGAMAAAAAAMACRPARGSPRGMGMAPCMRAGPRTARSRVATSSRARGAGERAGDVVEFPVHVPWQAAALTESASVACCAGMRVVEVDAALGAGAGRTRVATNVAESRPGQVVGAVGRPGPVLLLLHGFDSSAMEFRRLLPRLADLGVDAVAVDYFGFGFSARPEPGAAGSPPFGPGPIKAHVAAFVAQHLSGYAGGVVLCGASLGGGICCDLLSTAKRSGDADLAALARTVRALAVLDPQGYVDGLPAPMRLLPPPVDKWAVDVLGSIPLRKSAGDMSYADPATFATKDAVLVGRLHTLLPHWNASMRAFIKSGGFRIPPESIRDAGQDLPALILWGKDDGILPEGDDARWKADLPHARFVYVDASGHVPHLEQAAIAAAELAALVASLPLAT